MNFRILDLTFKAAKLRVNMTRILETSFAEKRGLTPNEELQWDSMSAQLAEVEAERENRRILERMLNEHVTHLLKQNGNAQ